MGRRLPRWTVQVGLNPSRVIVKGSDEDDAQTRFIEAVMARPSILLDLVEIELIEQAPDDADDVTTRKRKAARGGGQP